MPKISKESDTLTPKQRYARSLKGRQTMRLYYERNRDKYREYHLRQKQHDPVLWRLRSSEAEKRFNATPKGIWHILCTNAKKRGKEYVEQTVFVDWYTRQKKECHYCGIGEVGKRLEIERKDNNGGYTIHNMTLACADCNGVKGSILTEDEMLIVGQQVMRKRYETS